MTRRKYDLSVGRCDLAKCTILKVFNADSPIAKAMEFEIKYDCCGRTARINWQGMISRITRRTGLCWVCANSLAVGQREGTTRSTLEMASNSAAHPDFVPPPSWKRPPSIKPGYWLWKGDSHVASAR